MRNIDWKGKAKRRSAEVGTGYEGSFSKRAESPRKLISLYKSKLILGDESRF